MLYFFILLHVPNLELFFNSSWGQLFNPFTSHQDLLSVVAYGTPDGRSNALKVLSHYWPLDYDRPPMIPGNIIVFKLDIPYTQLFLILLDSFFPDCEFSNCSNKVDYVNMS